MNGYAHLVEFADDRPMVAGHDFIVLDQNNLKRTRNTRGILIGTSRTNPAKDISHPSHLGDRERTLFSSGPSIAHSFPRVDALVSIGGDDTLKTANKFRALPRLSVRRGKADRRGPRAQDDRQRLPRH